MVKGSKIDEPGRFRQLLVALIGEYRRIDGSEARHSL